MKKIVVLLTLVFAFSLVAHVSAQDIGFHRLAGKAGIIFPEDLGTGFMLGAAADLGELADNLHLVPLLSYWNSSKDESGVDLSLSNIQIGGDIQYYIENVEGLYFGGGLSLNFASVTAKATYFGQSYESSDSETKVGFDILGGYEIPLGKNTGFINAKYNIISDINTFAINVGMWFDMN